MDKEHTCCVTGHRDLTEEQKTFVELRLMDEVAFALEDGYTRFISGFADGTDLIFAGIVAIYKAARPGVTLEAAIPNRSRLKTKDPVFQRLLAVCDKVNVLSEGYDPGVFDRRNRWMVDQSSRVIAVHDLRASGGTVRTMRYAEKRGLDIREIFLP